MVDEARPPRGATRVDPGGGAAEATRPMIHVMQPNPAMDRIQPVASFVLGAVNRSDDVRVVPGGKGLNVARGLRDLGIPVAAYGFAGGFVGAYLRAACASLGIVDRHTAVNGESRICQIIVERDSGRSTVLNEPGPRVTRDDGRRLLASVTRQCRQGDIVVITGGTPPGLPEDFYARAVEAIQRRGGRAVVDTAGVQLRHALRYAPWIVKTNADEYVNASEGEPPRTEGELVAAMRRQVARGSWAVILTQGSSGAIAVTGVESWRIAVPAVRTVNATGSGDLFLAGLVAGLTAGDPLQDALKRAAACAVGSVTTLEPSAPPDRRLRQLMADITVAEL